MSLEDLVPRDAIRCALIGPSRVGKTSLVTAVIDDAQHMVERAPVHIVPADGPTAEAVDDSRDQMRNAIDLRLFNASALGGTGEPHLFNIGLDSSGRDRGHGLRFTILDYPGRWFKQPSSVPAERKADWDYCLRFMAESTVLLVPIDATVLMEATTPAEKAAVRPLLAVSTVERVVREWAKDRARAEDHEEQAVLVLCPLKCESYFDDNGGRVDRAGELLRRVQDVYGDTLAIARAETHGRPLQILYSPIDTYGCVEIVRAEWQPEFTAHYRVRPPGQHRPTGAAPIIQVLCQLLVEAESDAERRGLAVAEKERQEALGELFRPRGFFGRLAFKWSGDKQRLESAERRSHDEARAIAARVDELESTIKQLAAADVGPRVTWL